MESTKRMRRRKAGWLGGACAAATMALGLLASAGPAGAAGSGLHVMARIPGPDGGWDYASFDPARRRLYVAHGTEVLTVDVDTGKLNPAFAPGNRLHAVVPIPGTALVVTTNSGDNTAKILNADTGALIASVPTANDADGAIYDRASGDVIVICGDAGAVTIVDPRAAKAVAQITVGGALEFPALNGRGQLFINNEKLNEIDVVDLATRAVTAHWPMAGCTRPTGLAYVAGDRLVSACGNGVGKILSAKDGHEIASVTVGGFPDAVLYDAERGLALVPAALGGNLTVIALAGPDNNKVIDTVPTQIGARTGAVDPKTGRVYLPTAEYNLPVPAGQRPTTKPGTFQILVLDR